MTKKTNLPQLEKKSSSFFRFYVSLVWILILFCVFGWIYLYKTLNSYESSLPATRADAIIREMEDGSLSALTGLSEHDLNALKSHISVYGMRFAEKKELSREKGNYTYRISSQGLPLVNITLAPEGDKWTTLSAAVDKAVLNEYTDTIALQQAELVADCIAGCDYTSLYGVIQPTGYAEDSLEAFQSFMQKHTPGRTGITFARKDDGAGRGYDIITGNSLFGHITLSEISNSKWQIDSFSLNDSLKNAYVLSFADEKATLILEMIKNKNHESLYRLCTANGYPDGSSDRFGALIESIPDIEKATCSLFENSDNSHRSYLISAGNQRIASFTLSMRESNGTKLWALSSYEMPVWVPFEGTVTAPACFSVSVDGKMLRASDEISRTVPSGIDKYLVRNFPEMVTEVTYRIRSAFPPETIEAVSADGTKGAYTALSDNAFRFDLPTVDAEYKEDLHAFLVEFSEAWGRFSMNDTSYAEMVKYVEQLSTAYVYIYGGDYAWIKDHYEDKTSFSNFRTENFVRYDDETIACDIRYDMTVVYVLGDTVETYSPAYRIYLRRIHDDWKVFSFNSIIE